MEILAPANSFQLPRVLFDIDRSDEPDNDLSTEILPAPPAFNTIQQVYLKKETQQKRPPITTSYLPSSDPGSTYTGTGGVLSGLEVDHRSRKRFRLDKGHNLSRAQRASIRNTGAKPTSMLLRPADPQASISVPPFQGPTCNKQHSGVDHLGFSSVENARGRSEINSQSHIMMRSRGKSREHSHGKVKQEPQEFQSVIPREAPQPMSNQDHCSACRSVGFLLYCDSCPRSYHLWCLNPPMEHCDVPDPTSTWHCPACNQRDKPPRRRMPSSSLMNELIYVAHMSLPMEYTLPEEIRTYFKHVGTGPRGSYRDNSNTRPPRLGRPGIPDERDPYRLRDKNGLAVLCFQCGKSSLPQSETEISSSSGSISRRSQRAAAKAANYNIESMDLEWRTILSCDYCNLSWHLDCISPPLTSMPSGAKKWMCPNHAQQTLKNRRQPKSALPPVEINTRGQPNNGNIEIIPSEDVSIRNTVLVDEVLINGRTFRVPERVIILDFWDKLAGRLGNRSSSGDPRAISLRPNNSGKILDVHDRQVPSSPLTSLSSMSESGEDGSSVDDLSDVHRIAEALCNMSNIRLSPVTKHDPASPNPPMKIFPGRFVSPLTVDDESANKTDIMSPITDVSSTLPESPRLRSISRESVGSQSQSLSPCTPSESDGTNNGSPSETTPLKIRIPRPLNIAVAAATAARTVSVTNGTNNAQPRRSSRRRAHNATKIS